MTPIESARTTPDLTEIADEAEYLRRDFPTVSPQVLCAAVTAARSDLHDVPPGWLPELSERLAWWRIQTAIERRRYPWSQTL